MDGLLRSDKKFVLYMGVQWQPVELCEKWCHAKSGDVLKIDVAWLEQQER